MIWLNMLVCYCGQTKRGKGPVGFRKKIYKYRLPIKVEREGRKRERRKNKIMN